jgi:predicted AAA+ superfamily ATPase
VRQLPPWFENLSKRQVKAAKIYLRESGILHALLGVTNQRDLEPHPKLGASWEGYAVEEVLKALQPDDAFYWATYNGGNKVRRIFTPEQKFDILKDIDRCKTIKEGLANVAWTQRGS